MNSKAIVVDLDGTLVSINTFKSYISFVGRRACSAGRLDIAFILVYWVALRKMRFITHARMKFHILKYTERFMSHERLNELTDCLLMNLDRKVYDMAREYRKQEYHLCLSTAAPASYASLVAQIMGFDSFLATPMPSQCVNNSWRENVRDVKRDNTLEHLKQRQVSLGVLMTDHHDDIPLLKEDKEKNIIVNPTEHTIKRIRHEHIKFEILYT